MLKQSVAAELAPSSRVDIAEAVPVFSEFLTGKGDKHGSETQFKQIKFVARAQKIRRRRQESENAGEKGRTPPDGCGSAQIIRRQNRVTIGRAANERFRRARALLVYWQEERLSFFTVATRETVEAAPFVCELLDFFGRWRSCEHAVSHFAEYTPASIRSAVQQLARYKLLLVERSDDARADARLVEQWRSWWPAAAFHFATKDANYVDRSRWTIARRRKLLPKSPAPAKLKVIARAEKIPLPPRRDFVDSDFARVLTTRRTHRQFANAALEVHDVAQLLSLVWGVNGYVESPVFGRGFHKTSPSGGARHPVEVYIVALRVHGLRRGVYHYQPLHHHLEKISGTATPEKAWLYCARQHFVKKAAALFVMTAVFPRTMWKYPDPRAYRVVLLDAGHLCQTFCLAATWLGLAPFCTAALKDTLIESDLRVDGVRESVLYVAGLGVRRGR